MEKPIIEKAIRGTLKFLVFNRFYGFITRFDTREDIFVHGSEIRYINPMQFTRRCGDSVIFDLAVGVKGLEAVNVILNLAEQAAEDALGNDSTAVFEFAKPGLVIMKKKPVGDLESVITESELDSTYTYTGENLSLNAYPSLSCLTKYPSNSTLSKYHSNSSLSSLSCDDFSVFELNGRAPVPPSEEGPAKDLSHVEKADTAVGDADVLRTLNAKDSGPRIKDVPIADRTNSKEPKKDEKKLTLAECRGKSFRKMHEESLKREAQVP